MRPTALVADCPICQAICEDPQLAHYAFDVEVDRSEDAIILTGRVPSYYAKQLVQEAVRRHAGTLKIDNYVRVARSIEHAHVR